ncbi:MAG: hypothetical protein JW741_23880 [Sedimentisphaerales bacterium]|nr:hypothetical protein [Sedimentisphaerales bacterium]
MISTLERALSDTSLRSLYLVFWIGATASLSFCAVFRLPILLGYIAGSGSSRKKSLVLTGCFALGLVVSSVLLAALAASAGESPVGLLQANRLFFWSFGALLLVSGLFLSGLVSPQVMPQRWQRMADHLSQAGLWGALLLGFLSGLLTIPACPSCGAGVIALGGMVATRNLSLYGWMLFFSFALGQALPVVAVGVSAALLKPGLIKRLRTRMCSVEQRIQLLAGNMLMVFGLYYIVVG